MHWTPRRWSSLAFRIVLLTLWILLLGIWAQGASQQTAGVPRPAKEPKEITVARLGLFGTVTTAILSATAAVISAYIANREKKRANQIEAGSRIAVQKLEEQLLERYGFRAQQIFVRIEIQNLKGDAIIIRGWKGIEIRQNVTLASIPMKVEVASPQGRLLCPPTLAPQSSNGGKFPKEVTLVPVTTSEKSCHYVMEVTGALTQHDPPLDLTTRLEVRSAYLMTREDISTAYATSSFKQEYHAIEIDLPASLVDLEIRFPAGFKARTFAGVFLLGTETLHALESGRVQDGFEELESGARLKVEDPLPGFSYVIYWTPGT